MNQEQESPPLTRKIHVAEIEENVGKTIVLTDAEKAVIKGLLELIELENLSFSYRLSSGSGGRVHLSGRLKADTVQTCVVTLEPIPAAIDMPLDVEFWPAAQIGDLGKEAEDPSQAALEDWPEPITAGTIDLGPIVYETLATALDPYPKKTGASFQWSQAEPEAEVPESGPFAALKQLKKT